jgi:FixJ family two-component response regulator
MTRGSTGGPLAATPPQDFTLFVVDDNAGIRSSLKNLAATESLAVETYASGSEFLACYEPARRGCLLLDVRLRGESGLDLLDELRRRQITMPVIVMTGYGNVPTSIRAFKGGAIDFLQKPVSPAVLLERVRALMEVQRRERAADATREELRRRLDSLTPREREVMDRLVEGLISKEIAAELRVSTRTVEGHRRTVLRKMGATSAAHLVRLVMSSR